MQGQAHGRRSWWQSVQERKREDAPSLAGRWVPGVSWEPGQLGRTSAEAAAGRCPPLRPTTEADDVQKADI